MRSRVLGSALISALWILLSPGLTWAHDCSSPGDCMQTAGFNATVAVGGGAVALAVIGLIPGILAASGATQPAPPVGDPQGPQPPDGSGDPIVVDNPLGDLPFDGISGILRPADGPLTLNAIFDASGRQIFPTPDDLSDFPDLVAKDVLFPSLQLAAKEAGGIVDAISEKAGWVFAAEDIAGAILDQDPTKLAAALVGVGPDAIQLGGDALKFVAEGVGSDALAATALELGVDAAEIETLPAQVAIGIIEVAARVAGITPGQIDAIKVEAAQAAFNTVFNPAAVLAPGAGVTAEGALNGFARIFQR